MPGEIPDAQIATLVEKLRRIPDSARQFTVPPDATWKLFHLSPALLARLRAAGLPVRGGGEAVRYDLTDLRNVAMRMGGAAQAARRFWSAGMNRGSADGPARYEIRYGVSCPSPGHGGPCRWEFRLPDRPAVVAEAPAGAPPPAPAARVALRPDWPPLPDDARALMDCLAGVEFMRLPTSLRDDLGFIRDAGLADCLGTTRYLVGEGRRRGLPVRSRYGIMVVLPFSNRHNWAEVEVDGRWVPIDPVMLRWMIDWGVLASPAWDVYRSPGAILAGIAGSRVPLAVHNGEKVAVTLSTRRVRAPG